MTRPAITPTDKSLPLTWKRGGPTHSVSSDERYFINGARDPSMPDGFVYQAVRVVPKPSLLLLGRGTLEECRAAVEADR